MKRLNMNFLVTNAMITNAHMLQEEKKGLQSIISKQADSFEELFDQFIQQKIAVLTERATEKNDQPSLINIFSFTEEEAVDYLSFLMTGEDVSKFRDMIDNVPFMYQLEDVVRHLLNHLPVLNERLTQNIVEQHEDNDTMQPLSNDKEEELLETTVDRFMEQLTYLFESEIRLSEEELNLFTAMQPVIQKVLMKIDQTPKEEKWLQQLQMIHEQKITTPEVLLQAVLEGGSEEVMKQSVTSEMPNKSEIREVTHLNHLQVLKKLQHLTKRIDQPLSQSTASVQPLSNITDSEFSQSSIQQTQPPSFINREPSQLVAQLQQPSQLMHHQSSQSLQAILHQTSANNNEGLQMKVEGGTVSGLTSKDVAGELLSHRFQLNIEHIPEAKRGEKLMQELQAIMKRANFGRTGGLHRITVQLYPEQLGQIRIELQEHKGVLTARFLASVAMTKDLLERQMQQLRQALSQHTQVERIEVVQMLQEAPRHEREHFFQQQQRHHQQQQSKKHEKEKEKEKTFEEFLAYIEEVNDE